MTLNCNGKIINFDDQKIMGILNVSDNSFYDGGNFNSIDKALSHVDKMINDGVDIIDLGGISSKPGSKIIDSNTELKYISKYVEELSRQFNNITFSIDTYNSKVAEYAL
ncbi:MAG: dihydropteroate synthase, partial [Flavobacteriaceae bacterium]